MEAQSVITSSALPTVCLVDDDPVIRTLFSRVIQRTGCKFIVACNATEAVSVVATSRIDIVLSDLMMPDFHDGEQLLKTIVKDYPHICICMMSGNWSSDIKAQMLEYGASACLQKPFTADEFSSLINELQWNGAL